MKKIIKKYTATSIIVASFALTMIMIFAKPSPKPVQNKFVPPVVETMNAIPQSFKVRINSQGTVVPRTEITLTSEIPGKIDFVSPQIQSGSSFDKGDTLLILDQRDFELALIAAQSSMYQAQVVYEREVAESEVAKKEWSNINGGKASSLALRKPQLDQAKAALAAAEANYQRALLNVERTFIRAPFKGRVRNEYVDIGMVVSPGIPLAQIYAIDMIEVTLPIAESDIKFLSIPLDGRVVSVSEQPSMVLTSTFAGLSQAWRGKILRSAAEIDSKTRMLSVIGQVSVNSSKKSSIPIKVGMFVNATIEGKSFNDIYVIPREKVRDGEVWVLNNEGILSKRNVSVLRYEKDKALISDGFEKGDKVLLTRLDVLVEGMKLEKKDQSK
jgi:RND family efflux transporter MFP subunit|tara:strand:+ start:893 stop:2047 length:1155 start_codon:yes stop_codon:yes gene_type:complete